MGEQVEEEAIDAVEYYDSLQVRRKPNTRLGAAAYLLPPPTELHEIPDALG